MEYNIKGKIGTFIVGSIEQSCLTEETASYLEAYGVRSWCDESNSLEEHIYDIEETLGHAEVLSSTPGKVNQKIIGELKEIFEELNKMECSYYLRITTM